MDKEQQEFSYIAGGMQNGKATLQIIWQFLKKFNKLSLQVNKLSLDLTHNLANPPLDIYLSEINISVH